MKETKVEKEILWINISKAMGIIAVIIDHTKGTLYNNQNIANFSYYSVSLFVLISGYLTFASYERHKYKFEKAITHFTKK